MATDILSGFSESLVGQRMMVWTIWKQRSTNIVEGSKLFFVRAKRPILEVFAFMVQLLLERM